MKNEAKEPTLKELKEFEEQARMFLERRRRELHFAEGVRLATIGRSPRRQN